MNLESSHELSAITRAKRILGVDRLVLQIHDASFPSDPEEDIGRGSPYSIGAERLFRFAARLGFDAVQLGPQGMTWHGNPSPYDGCLFSRNPMNLPLARLADRGRLRHSTLRALQSGRPTDSFGRTPYQWLFESYRRVAQEIAALAGPREREAARRYMAQHESWVVPDALYAVLCAEHGAGWWGDWNRTSNGRFDQCLFNPAAGQEDAVAERLAGLRVRYSKAIEDHALIQYLLDAEHLALRQRLSPLGLALWGDLQIGPSQHDAWAWQRIFLEGYRMGAPPSRTNREGQPWGYRVPDPAQYGTPETPGPALAFVKDRLDRMLREFDGLRVDHPHGWIDPWVYFSDDESPLHAVQTGARLFSSPDEADHPGLRRFAIARPGQINRTLQRHADNRVFELDDNQVTQYGLLMDTVMEQMATRCVAPGALACEVLSTQPYPVGRVLERHGLGRFRVVQKANLDDPADVYRLENAMPEDWVMLGTHDTPPIWALARSWSEGSQGLHWARHLAPMLAPEQEHDAFITRTARDPGTLVHAIFSATLASRARHVLVFFADLFGITQRYNEPGVVDDANWSLRLPSGFEDYYEERRRLGQALDIGRCLAGAVRVRETQRTE
jgi:4-alpha-glucanotransferase